MAERPKEVLAFDSSSKGKFNKTPFKKHKKPATSKCRYCGGKHKRSRSACPAYWKACTSRSKPNHFASICTQRNDRGQSRIKPKKTPIHQSSCETSSNSRESIATVSLTPDKINAVQGKYPTKIETVMKIKGRKEAKFQIDTGATCSVIKACEITGTQYANQVMLMTQMLKMFNSTTLRPIGKCKIQVCNPKSNQKHNVIFMVMRDKTCANLIGSQAAQQMGFLDIHFEQLHNSLAAPKP